MPEDFEEANQLDRKEIARERQERAGEDSDLIKTFKRKVCEVRPRGAGKVIDREKERANHATHKNIVLVTEGELQYCKDCRGGEVELFEKSCEERRLDAARENLEASRPAVQAANKAAVNLGGMSTSEKADLHTLIARHGYAVIINAVADEIADYGEKCCSNSLELVAVDVHDIAIKVASVCAARI